MNVEDVKVGMRFQNLDPREEGRRIVVVTYLHGNLATVENEKTKRVTYISIVNLRESKGGRGWRLLP